MEKLTLEIKDKECRGCELHDANCIIHEDRHICMPAKRTGYKVVDGILETIEIIEGFEDG